MIQFNSQNTFKEIHYDGHDIKYAYGGCSGDLVWEKSSPTPSYKLKAEYNGVSYELPWDGNPILTSGETLSLYNLVPSQSYGTYVGFTVGNNVTELGDGCFNINKSLYVGEIRIPSSVKTIGTQALYNANNTANGKIICEAFDGTLIKDQNFTVCSVEETLDLSRCYFENNRLYFSVFYTYNIKNLILPDSLTSLVSAPSACNALESATILAATPPSLGNSSFDNCPKLRVIYVPSESVNDYKTAWSSLSNIIQAIPT